jgi:superfamily I DNA and RNA helicase
MTLEIVYGEPRHRAVAKRLADSLRSVASIGTVYLGYPVLATADERVHVDALLISQEHGLVAFQIAATIPESDVEWRGYISEQDRLFSVLEAHLGRHEQLRRGRKLAVPIQTITVFSDKVDPPQTEGIYCGIGEVAGVVSSFAAIDESLYVSVQAALQRVTTIKPAKRRVKVTRPDSRGAVLKIIEKGVANLDRWQKQAAIETPQGPQRIRGLAGSGKTIVLALKAAYLHSQYPQARIAVCFMSRSLYQQFEDLVTRFTFEHSNDKPDFDYLRLLHAWGASNRGGFYKTIAAAMGAPFRDFNYAVSTYGRDDAFAGVCRELLEISNERTFAPIFDAVLIDEAQDLPSEFFQLVYRFTKPPKRIVWAYDELQNLSEAAMPATDELFGVDAAGESLVELSLSEEGPATDIVLPVCYRNSPWALATAHALGFGIYRSDGGLVQFFEGVELWEQIGYEVVSGKLRPGRRVTLRRRPESYPAYFPDLLAPEDAVMLRTFKTELEQDTWVATQINTNLKRDELDIDDILIVLPDAYTSKRRATRVSRALAQQGIESHLAGVGSSVDELYVSGSVAIAHIWRAKGNEAPMVYVLDSQYGAPKFNAVARRNTLFTAVTRSRAWVRILGWGPEMAQVANEVQRVQEADFTLAFTVPTASQLEKIRRLNRERSREEVAKLRRVSRSLDEAFRAVEGEEIDLEDLPVEVRRRLKKLIKAGLLDNEDEDELYDDPNG